MRHVKASRSRAKKIFSRSKYPYESLAELPREVWHSRTKEIQRAFARLENIPEAQLPLLLRTRKDSSSSTRPQRTKSKDAHTGPLDLLIGLIPPSNKKKADVARTTSVKKHDRGLVIAYFGEGKGKTTAAFGMAMRALGRGMNVVVLQFIKGEPGVGKGITWTTGERIFSDAIARSKVKSQKPKVKEPIGELFVKALGEGFVKILGDKRPFGEHRRAARKALQYAGGVIRSGRYQLVILDEILRAIGEQLLTVQEVLSVIRRKPRALHLVLTGHRLPSAIARAADLVTEMRKVKHPYDKGILAKIGVDF